MVKLYLLLLLIHLSFCRWYEQKTPEEQQKEILEKEKFITKINESGFENLLNENQFLLLIVDSTNDCEVCKKNKIYNVRIAAEVIEFNIPVKVVEINFENCPKIVEKYNLNHPGEKSKSQHFFINNGKIKPFLGDPNPDYIIKFLQDETHLPSKRINTLEELEEIKNIFVSVLLFVPEDCPVLMSYQRIARYLDAVFFHTHNKDLVSEYNKDNKYTLVVFRSFGKTKILSSPSPFPLLDMNNFIRKYMYPNIVEYSKPVIDFRVRSYKRPAFVFVSDIKRDKEFKVFEKFCQEFKHKVICAASFKKDFHHKEHVNQDHYVKLIEFEDDVVKRFNLEGLDREDFVKAYEDWKNGEIIHHIKSAPPIELLTNLKVKEITADDLWEKVLKNYNYILVQIFSNKEEIDEELSRKKMLIFENLASTLRGKADLYKFNKDKNFHFIMPDNTNDSIYLFSPGNEKGIKYEGDFTFRDIRQFFIENTHFNEEL